jgi:nucleotide-binding universal stress UspA family protein
MASVYRNILVAVDGSRDSKRALSQAVALARDQKALLTLITVVPPTSGISMASAAAQSLGAEDAFNDVLREAAASIPDDVGVTTVLAEGQPARRIIDRAIAGDHDLIVMGSRGLGRIAGALLGSVSHQVLHSSPVPVLVAHSPRGEAEDDEALLEREATSA